jgi:SNF2 family DNA or RNA helicase
MNTQVFGTNWYAFKFNFGVWGGWGRHQLKGYRHLNELIGKIRDNSFIIKKEQCMDLPPKLYETVPVQLSDHERELYNKMAKEAIIEIEETHATAAIVIVKMLRLRQMTSGFVKDIEGNIRVFGDSKLSTCMDLLDDLLEEDHKVVIFVEFLNDIKRIKEKLDARKIHYGILSGSVPPETRDSLIDEFQTNPEMQVFVAQLQTGSEGIELFAADVAIYYSLNHNALYYWQSQDRIHRRGQTKKVTYYHLVVPHSVDQAVLTALKAKQNVAEFVLHKPQRLLGLI